MSADLNPTSSTAGAPGAPPLARLLDQAADAVMAVQRGRSLTDALATVPGPLRPGTQALSFLALRRLGAAQALREIVANRTPPPQVESLLLVALALLWPEDGQPAPYPDHTLVDQAVNCARRRVPAAANFINAVLRRFVRERAALVAQVSHQPVAAWNHPAWWIERLRADWPAHWQGLLQAAQQRPPLTLRVNRRRGTGAQYQAQLAVAGLAAELIGPQALLLAQAVPVERLPGFAQGWVSVQDASAQLAAPLLLGAGLPAGARVLDACAAPGGKTAHLLELAELDLLALDSDAQRLARVGQTLQRLQLQAELRAADARQTAAWWDGRPFDAILLDAPCSAAGIVRRHPDIRWLRRADDIGALAAIQAELLDTLWGTLKPGGRLLFATCSVFRAEGQAQIDAFLQRRGPDGARLDPVSPGHLLPLPDNGPNPAPSTPGVTAAGHGDGFFYALLHKPEA